MARFFITLVVGFAALLLWFFIATLLMRLFGAPLSLPFSKAGVHAAQLLTFTQSVWFGVLFFGGGMFIVETLYEYLSWRYWHAPYKDFSIGLRVFLWPVAGLFIGLLQAGGNKNRRASELSKQRLKEVSGWDENGFSR